MIKCQVRSTCTVDQLFCHLLFFTLYMYIHTSSQRLILLFACNLFYCLHHNLRLSSQDTVFQLWYNLSCTQWLEWCLGICIVIANVSLLSSFQLTSPPGKLFKDKFLNTFCLLIVSLLFLFYFLVSQFEVGFQLHVKGKHDCF